MNEPVFILKGNVVYSKNKDELRILKDHYLISESGLVKGVFEKVPPEYAQVSVSDYGECLIIPGLTDLHVHAPQYTFRAMGMDMELLEWLETNTFPEEAKYQDLEYARRAYRIFTDNLKRSVTTRACIFGTIHRDATLLLMDQLEQSGLVTYVGKVNMDRNCPDYLREESAEESGIQTVEWIKDVLHKKYQNTMPILTPRFTPSCSDELMENLKKIQMYYQIPVQSHLSENPGEIAWVKELCPNTHFYGEAYSQFDLFGGDCPTIMAHCVHSSDEEIALMKKQGVYIAHCPQSNTNLASGISPVRRYLDEGLHIGLGSDIAGGTSVSILRAMADAIQVSKLYWRLVDSSMKPLTVEEAFYMGTEGGGSFFGKVGSFKEGYEFDAVVLNDSTIPTPLKLSPKDRLERLIYLSDDRNITAKYVAGRKIL